MADAAILYGHFSQTCTIDTTFTIASAPQQSSKLATAVGHLLSTLCRDIPASTSPSAIAKVQTVPLVHPAATRP